MWFRTLGGSLAAVVLLCCQSVSAELVTGFDVVVGGTLDLRGQIQGRTLVGTTVTGNASYGTGLTPSSAYSDTDVLVVGGSLQSGNITVQAGDVRLGGTQGSASVTLNGPGSQLFQNDASAVTRAAGIGQQLDSLSALYGSLEANSTYGVVYTPQASTVTFIPNPGAEGIAVFDVPADLLEPSNAQFLIDTTGLPSDTTYVFNVRGPLTSAVSGKFGENFTDPTVQGHSLWNFVDQTSSISLNQDWYGSILAPNASLQTTGPVNGGVYVGGDFTSNNRVNLPSFEGAVLAAVPEPSGMVLAATAGLGFLGARLRRRKSRVTRVRAPAPREFR